MPKTKQLPEFCVDEKIAEISFFTSLAQSHISSTNVFIYIRSVFLRFLFFSLHLQRSIGLFKTVYTPQWYVCIAIVPLIHVH